MMCGRIHLEISIKNQQVEIMPEKRKNPMGEWWRRLMQKVKQAGEVYVKAHRHRHKVG